MQVYAYADKAFLEAIEAYELTLWQIPQPKEPFMPEADRTHGGVRDEDRHIGKTPVRNPQSDTSKMTPEEYAKHVEGLATKIRSNVDVTASAEPTGRSTSSKFKPGQTVWNQHTHEMFDIVAINGPNCWCWSVSRCHYETISADDLLATNPNQPAEPAPQKCPSCGSTPVVGDCNVSCDECWMAASKRHTRLEAIQAWNSIRVGGIFDGPEYDKIEEMAKQKIRSAPEPCPACGAGAELLADCNDQLSVYCSRCGMRGPRGESGPEAVLAWDGLGNVAEEREACAKIAYLAAQKCGEGFGGMILANDIARDILKRGQQ